MHMVTIGKVGKAFGVNGYLVIHSYTDPIDNILSYTPWQMCKANGEIIRDVQPTAHEVHHRQVIVKFSECDTPEQARAYTHAWINIDRSQLPQLEEGYYWSDLVGLQVINEENEVLGIVERVDNHGPHDLLYVKNQKKLYTLPYVDAIILGVSLQEKTIHVSWPSDMTA